MAAHPWSAISFTIESSGNSLKLYESQHVCLSCPIRPPLVWAGTGLSGLMDGGSGWQGISFTTLFSYSIEALPKCLSTASMVYCGLTRDVCVCVYMCSFEDTHTCMLKDIINLLWCFECIFLVCRLIASVCWKTVAVWVERRLSAIENHATVQCIWLSSQCPGLQLNWLICGLFTHIWLQQTAKAGWSVWYIGFSWHSFYSGMNKVHDISSVKLIYMNIISVFLSLKTLHVTFDCLLRSLKKSIMKFIKTLFWANAAASQCKGNWLSCLFSRKKKKKKWCCCKVCWPPANAASTLS